MSIYIFRRLGRRLTGSRKFEGWKKLEGEWKRHNVDELGKYCWQVNS